MILKELIEKVAKEEVSVILADGTKVNCNLTKAAAGRILEFVGRSILADLLLDGRSTYPGLGIFTVVTRAARTFHNPKGGDPIPKPERKTIKFKPFAHTKAQLT